MERAATQLVLSNHAEKRRQQRGVTMEAIEVVYRFGRRRRTSRGFSYSMDADSRRQAERDLPREVFQRVADRIDFYLGIARDGFTVTTVAHRLRKARRS